jgi:3-deoxy-D-manno-octulosonic-acid transferase
MRQIYSFIITLYGLSLWISSLFYQKARDWFYGRREIFTKLEEVFSNHYHSEDPSPVAWIHCASLGEYEQARPVIEEIKSQHPQISIILTFFSPSGFNNKASNSGADFVFYLPLDTRKNARKFLRIVSPSIAIFVKYEYWYNYLHELKEKNIPTYMISAIFRPSQHFFKWYGGWFRTHLRNLNKIFVQEEVSAELLSMIDVNNVIISGDTRFDRVAGIGNKKVSIPYLDEFSKDSFTLVAGSTWPPDEAILQKLFESSYDSLKLIIAPHEINRKHLDELSSKFSSNCEFYSKIRESNLGAEEYFKRNKPRVIIIDSIGLLSKLYRYGKLAYIGGGFGVGIHNTLEAAVYGMPVLFGPNFHKFKEAQQLIEVNAGVSVKDEQELIQIVNIYYSLPDKLRVASEQAAKFVKFRTGATSSIMSELESVFDSLKVHQS